MKKSFEKILKNLEFLIKKYLYLYLNKIEIHSLNDFKRVYYWWKNKILNIKLDGCVKRI